MKIIIWTVLGMCFGLVGLIDANAQAPSSVAGKSFVCDITGGSLPFAPSGYFLFAVASSGSGYRVIGISEVANSSGTYSYSASGASATANFTDTVAGLFVGTFNFTTASTGNYTLRAGPYFQNGTFEMFSSPAPNSVLGNAYYILVNDGAYPFAGAGSILLKIPSSGSSYTVTGDGIHTANSLGTYSYSKVTTTTGSLSLNDSVTGISTAYLAFSNSIAGRYAVAQPSSGAFQIGHFINLKTSISITSPTSSLSYTNLTPTINLRGVASDSLGIAQVTWSNDRGGSGTASGTTSWSAPGINLQNGLNVITVTALDTVGNTAQAALTVTYSLPPILGLAIQGTNAILSWSTTVAGFRVESATNFLAGGWNTNYPKPVIVAGRYTVTNPITRTVKMFRLFIP